MNRREEINVRLSEITTEMDRLGTHDTLTRSQDRQVSLLTEEVESLEGELRLLDRDDARSRLGELVRSGNVHFEGPAGSGIEPTIGTDRSPLGELRDTARRSIDLAHRAGHLPDYAAEKVERMLSDGSEREQSITARWAAATGSEHYRSAFRKLLTDPTRGHLLWDTREQAAYQDVAAVRTAMSLSSTHGHEMVPLTLDPAILLTSAGSINPLRQISRVVQTTTDAWAGVTSAGATAEWKAEASEAADGSPTLANPSIPVYAGDVFVPYSYEIGMDAINFEQEIGRVMTDAADQLQATAYTTGAGSTQPKGVVTALAGSASEINSVGSEALVAADLYALQNALPPRFQARASWTANIATINTVAQFETTNGALKFPEVANDRLLRKPLHELSNMDGSVNAAATASNYLLIYGAFENFVIVDRIGTTIRLIPDLVGSNHRPTAQHGLFLYFRTGSDVVVTNAFRMLDVETTA